MAESECCALEQPVESGAAKRMYKEEANTESPLAIPSPVPEASVSDVSAYTSQPAIMADTGATSYLELRNAELGEFLDTDHCIRRMNDYNIEYLYSKTQLAGANHYLTLIRYS